MFTSNEDIYEYQFNSLFRCVRPIIGRDTLKVYETKEEEQEEKELDELFGHSELLFDISGKDFKWFKACEAEYKYWVEVFIVKIIENLLTRKGITFEEKYYPESKEQYSIICELKERRVEAYFLYDLETEDVNRTDYNMIADALAEKANNVEKIHIYIFRDCISMTTLAYLVNDDGDKNANGFVEVLPLHCFFDDLFGKEEYSTFSKYASLFQENCNSIISYKTVIAPTKKTLEVFKKKKSQMLKDMDYLAIANKGQSGNLSVKEFEKVKGSFLKNKMYKVMVSSNDFADSFISAEWSYDVYQYAMGELELTGIITGYLKSIEQLMYKIVRFHKNQGLRIKTTHGYQRYTSDNEDIIDSTLWSLNAFLTSPQGKLAISRSIRESIQEAVDLWRRYQRNGYFHKDNLYAVDNKISEVREQTIYLYFLLLGGIYFSSEERAELGVSEEEKLQNYSEKNVYKDFEKWMKDICIYDLPGNIPGIWILLTHSEGPWKIHLYLMKYFYIDDFENGVFPDICEIMEHSHTKAIPPFLLNFKSETYNSITFKVKDLVYRFKKENPEIMDRIGAIVLGLDKNMELIYVK